MRKYLVKAGAVTTLHRGVRDSWGLQLGLDVRLPYELGRIGVEQDVLGGAGRVVASLPLIPCVWVHSETTTVMKIPGALLSMTGCRPVSLASLRLGWGWPTNRPSLGLDYSFSLGWLTSVPSGTYDRQLRDVVQLTVDWQWGSGLSISGSLGAAF